MPALSFKSPILRRVATLSVTALVLGIAGLLGATFHGTLADRAAASDAPEAAPALPVTAGELRMQNGYEILRRFAGQVEAPQRTDLSFEESGTLDEIAVREGAQVARGDVLARLDTRLLEAERARLLASRDALVAQVELARRTNDRQNALQDRGFATAQTVDDTSLTLARLQAGIAEVEAGLAAVDIRIAKTVLRAPYAGIVSARLLDVGAVAAPGAPVISLLDGSAARFRVGVDPRLANGFALGDGAMIETDRGSLSARLTQIAPDLDPATRSRTLFYTFEGAAPPARSTAELTISQQIDEAGAWLPLSALRQGPEGTWQIVTVERLGSETVAGIEAVEIVAIDGPRTFVRGTFAGGARYVTEGTHRVVAGERIRPTALRVAEVAR